MSKARYLEVDRSQLRWDLVDLESQLAMDHRARIVWAFVEELDLRAFHDRIGSREDSAGRPPPDPKILLSLWLYATLEGLGSARALDRACQTDTAYRWLCGGVAMNYHSLSDFRSGNGELLDELLTENVCALMAAGLVSLDEVVQDGTKVRAAAGRGSFVGEDGLLGYEKKARARVHRLREELETDPGASDRRGRAARERAAEEVGERARQARETLGRLRQEKAAAAKSHKKAEAEKSERQVSTTDPEARLMTFADGSKAAAFNVQVAADGWFVVGVAATDRRNDTGLAAPMVEQLAERYERTPSRLVVDSKIATRAEIVALDDHPKGRVEVYAPVPEERENVKPESQRKRAWQRRKEPAAVKAWRARMETEEGDAAMQRRKHIETLIAITKNRGMRRMLVRGIEKVRSCVLFQALANNLMQAHRLRAVNQPA
jgi:transposase